MNVRLCECGSETGTGATCRRCYKTRWAREKYVAVPPRTGPVTGPCSYDTAHMRVKSFRGYARTHDCVDCGKEARDWSYDGRCPLEQIGYRPGRTGLFKWSPDPRSYSPRCVPCHKKFDLKENPE